MPAAFAPVKHCVCKWTLQGPERPVKSKREKSPGEGAVAFRMATSAKFARIRNRARRRTPGKPTIRYENRVAIAHTRRRPGCGREALPELSALASHRAWSAVALRLAVSIRPPQTSR
jgi:hypothetical protein